MEIPQIIQIHDYNVSFYGGQLQQKNRITIGLVNASYGQIGWIKFYGKDEDIPPDEFDEIKMLHMNLPMSSFAGVISTLRTGRIIKLIYVKESKVAMLFEHPPEMPPNMFPGSDFSNRVN